MHILTNSCEERKFDAKLVDSNKFIWATFGLVLYFLYVSWQTCVVICVDLCRFVYIICKHGSVRFLVNIVKVISFESMFNTKS